MVRRICATVALLAGVAVALLVASDVRASYDGQPYACTTVINAAAVDAPLAARPREACHDALVTRAEQAGLVLVLCLVAGTGAVARAVEPGVRALEPWPGS